MAEINIKITAQTSDFNQFANELGYLTEVFKTAEELALLTPPISIQDRLKPNPQTKQQFLEDYFKGIVISELYRKKAQIIDSQVNATKEAEKVAIKAGITGAVSVNSVA